MTVALVGRGSGGDIQQTLANVLTANNLRAYSRSYSHAPLQEGMDIAVEHDSSVRGESRFQGVSWHSIEVKTRILNGISQWESIVPKCLEICRYMGARVNQSCGFHLHLDLPEVTDRPMIIRNIFNLFHRYEKVIYGLVPPSREDNGYARHIPSGSSRLLHGCRSWQSFERALHGWDRHCGLNLTPLFDRGGPRIELRYHSGTLDPSKARHWLRFCLQMVQHAINRNCQAAKQQTANERKGLENMLMSCGFKVNSGIYVKVDPQLRETGRYLLRRWKQFNGGHALRPRNTGQQTGQAD